MSVQRPLGFILASLALGTAETLPFWEHYDLTECVWSFLPEDSTHVSLTLLSFGVGDNI